MYKGKEESEKVKQQISTSQEDLIMTTLKDVFRIGLIVLVISFFLIQLRVKQSSHNLHAIKNA